MAATDRDPRRRKKRGRVRARSRPWCANRNSGGRSPRRANARRDARRRPPRARSSPRRSRCRAWCHRTRRRRRSPTTASLELKYLDYRDWQPGASRMTVRSPSIYTLMPVNDTLEFEGSVVYDAMSGASPSTTTRSPARPVSASPTTGPPAMRSSRSTSTAGRSAWAASCRPSAITSRAARRSMRASYSDDRNRTYAFSIAGANDRINPQNSNAGGITNAPRNTPRVPRRHHAGALADADRPVEPHVLVRTRVLRRSRTSSSTSVRGAQDLRVAHALQPVFRRARRRAAAVVPVSARFVRQRFEHAHRRVGPGAAAASGA